MPSKAVAGGMAVVGLAIMIGCAVPMSKEKDKSSSKYKGLIAGVVIGVLMLVAGIAMFFMGGGSNSGNLKNAVANQSGAVQQVADPINALETGLIQQEAAAKHMLNTTNNALKTANKLKGALSALATIKK
jgi:flagellar basal body-associated protein FliL